MAEEGWSSRLDQLAALLAVDPGRTGAGSGAAPPSTQWRYRMLVVMVAFTSLGLWLLSAAS
jgi:hypothetical protein